MKRYHDVKLTDYEGNEREFVMTMATKNIVAFEQIYRELTGDNKATLFNSIEKLQQGDIAVIVSLVSASIHEKVNGIPAKYPFGYDRFDDEFNLLENVDVLMQGLDVVMKDLKINDRGVKKGK